MLQLKDCYKVNQLATHGSAPIPQEGSFTKVTEVKQISGFSHGVGGCAPQQGACKLTLNVKDGIIKEALVETVGCSGMTQSAAMAAEILPGKTLLEALNTDLVCDAINVAMRELFLQIAYGRSQSAFSLGGLEVGSGLEDLGKYLSSQVGTVYATSDKGVRYLTMAEGHVTRLALDKNSEVIGYEFLNTNAMISDIQKGVPHADAYTKNIKTFGRFSDAVKTIDPRKE
jgi:NifU-like protein involved in Fe-S cluster formation